jgi:hypothetical protein
MTRTTAGAKSFAVPNGAPAGCSAPRSSARKAPPKRIDVLATALWHGTTVKDLINPDLS